MKTERLGEKTESLKLTSQKVKEKCRLTGSWFGFQVPRRRGGVEAGRGRRRRPGKGVKKVLVHSYSIFLSSLAGGKYKKIFIQRYKNENVNDYLVGKRTNIK